MAKKFDAITCTFCNTEFAMTEANTVVCLFTKQPWYSYLLVACDCGGKIRYWVFPQDLKTATEAGCGLIEEDYAPDDLVEMYRQMKGYPPHKEYRLTTRLEKECQALAEVLTNIPDELLKDIINSPAPYNTMPERWNDD